MMELDSPAQNVQGWRAKLPELVEALERYLQIPLPFIPNHKLDDLVEEAKLEWHTSDCQAKEVIKKLMYREIDSRSDSISELTTKISRVIYDANPDYPISSQEIQTLINEIATRKALGYVDKKRNVFEDKFNACMWCWEVDDYPQNIEVKKERNMLGKVVKHLYKLSIEVSKVNIDEVNASQLFDCYNHSAKIYEKFKEEQLCRKRKREEEQEFKNLKKTKIEEDKLLKKQIKDQEKIAKKLKAEEEKTLKKQMIEEEKLLKKQKAEEEKNSKLIQKQQEEVRKVKKPSFQDTLKQTPVKPSIKPITHFFNLSYTPSSASSTPPTSKSTPTKKLLFDKLKKFMIPSAFKCCRSYSPEEGSLKDWIHKWRTEIKVIPSRSAFIFIHDSILNPYFTGKPALNILRKNPYHLYNDVNYDIDSEEEYEELNGEDLGEEEEDTEEESNSDDEEDENKWVVPDGYFSASEFEEGEEAPQPFVFSGNNEQKPIRILKKEEELRRFAGFSMKRSLPIECIILETPMPLPKPPKKNINHFEEDLKKCAEGKINKKQIIETFKEIHPDIPKSTVENKIKEVFIRVKETGKQAFYTLRSLSQPTDSISIIDQKSETAVFCSSISQAGQTDISKKDGTSLTIREIKPKYVSQSKVTHMKMPLN